MPIEGPVAIALASGLFLIGAGIFFRFTVGQHVELPGKVRDHGKDIERLDTEVGDVTNAVAALEGLRTNVAVVETRIESVERKVDSMGARMDDKFDDLTEKIGKVLGILESKR